MADYMIDIESLSTESDALLLSVGMVKFDPYAYSPKHALIDDSFYRVITLDFNNGSIDEDTLLFWFRQPKEIQDAIFGATDTYSLERTLFELREFMGCRFDDDIIPEGDRVWCHPPKFDASALEYQFQAHDMCAPWEHWQLNDSKTLRNIINDQLPPRDGLHNALADAVWQAWVVQKFFYTINQGRYVAC